MKKVERKMGLKRENKWISIKPVALFFLCTYLSLNKKEYIGRKLIPCPILCHNVQTVK